MKKLIAAVTLMLVFSINVNAQAKKAVVKETIEKITPEVAAKKNADELAKYLDLKGDTALNFERLFKMKQEVLLDKNMSEERKAEMSRIVELKIRATLDGEQMDKLEKNPELFKKMLN
jgi:hypothetical protein